ncbi:hypothetical protein D3C81_1773560 [compost metagenome]
MGKHIIYAFARKQNRKLLPAVTVRFTSTRHILDDSSYQLEYLVPRIMAIGIIKFFEMVNIQHRYHIIDSELHHILLKSTSRRQACQLIGKRHRIRVLNN